MEKYDISETDFSIKKVLRIIKAENKNYHKKFFVNGRPSDVFVYIISGSSDYECEGGNRFTVKAGDIMYLAKNEKYSIYINEENYRFIFCDFEFFDDLPRKSAVFSPKYDLGAEKLFVRLLNIYNAKEKTYFQDSLSLMYSIYSAIVSTKSDLYIRKTIQSKILYIKEYIDNHYSDISLNVSALANMADMSDVYFRKLFKAEVGETPSKYIISVRLKRAKQFMKYYPFLTLEECAKQSGFSSLHYFSRIFKNEFGINPSKYRKEK